MILRRLIRVGASDVKTVVTTICGVEIRFAKLVQPFSKCSSLVCSDESNLRADSLPEKQKVRMEKPKTPIKPFVRFSMKYRSLFRAKYPEAHASEILKRLAMVWNQMSSDDRSVYFDSYAKEYDVYYENLREYRTHFNVDYQRYLDGKIEKQRHREECARKRLLKKYFRMPTKPVNPFLLFASERKTQENVITKTRLECQLWTVEMGRVWRSLPEKQKQKYRDKYHELLGIHEDLIIEWEKEVVEAGFAFLLPESKRIDFQPTNTRYKQKRKSELSRLLTDSAEEESEEVTNDDSSESPALSKQMK